ncbi:MAG: aldose 1-epimerase family protein [Chloroflexi bacterium]|nr:aldose 1-epimerase family protein [Chloroflexota bacterium]
MLSSDWLAKDQLYRHSVDMRQFIDFRQSTLPSGARHIAAYNASGLSFSLLPDRGLDVWAAHYRGIPLTWLSLGSPHPPAAGQNWLRAFNGGLVTTCGLRHAGAPEVDAQTGEELPLHGIYHRSRAYDIATSGGWTSDANGDTGDDYALELTATIPEARLSGEQLVLTRTVRLPLSRPSFTITDHVVNQGWTSEPLMVLYHVNLGYPAVRAGAALDTPHAAIYPRDEPAWAGFEAWPVYGEPAMQYDEQVYFHHLNADANGQTRIALVQSGFGFEIAWDSATLPYFTQWKNTRYRTYVCGLEPGNCIPEGVSAARDAGRLVILEPGDEQRFSVTFSVLDGTDAVAGSRAKIASLRESGTPIAGCTLDDYVDEYADDDADD